EHCYMTEPEQRSIMKKYDWLMAIGAVSMLGFLSQPALAVPTLTLSDGIAADTKVIVDIGVGDLNPASGVVLFSGSLGVFNINVTSGFTKPAVGSASAPEIDISSFNNARAAGTLTITFSEDGFTGFPGNIVADFGGTQMNGNITSTVLQNGMLVTTIGPLSDHSFAGSTTGSLTGGAPYSLTQSVVMNFSGAGNKSFDAHVSVAVPDGGMTVTLLGVGLAGLAGVGRLRQRLVKA